MHSILSGTKRLNFGKSVFQNYLLFKRNTGTATFPISGRYIQVLASGLVACGNRSEGTLFHRTEFAAWNKSDLSGIRPNRIGRAIFWRWSNTRSVTETVMFLQNGQAIPCWLIGLERNEA